MRKTFGILFALVLVVSLGLMTATPVAAATTTSVPGDYPTIQAALNVSEDGDTIIVAAGEYDAFIVEGKANINIISTEGATVTGEAMWLLGHSGPAIAVGVMAVVANSININIEGIDFDGTELCGGEVRGILYGILYIDSTGRIADLTVENVNVIGTKLGAGVVIMNAYGSSELEITGCTISNNERGMWVATDSTQEAHFNNIAGNGEYGLCVEGGATVDATHNWWGDASGPYHESLNPGGTGDLVSDNVDFEPWLEAGVVAAKTETVTGGGTVDATDEADTELVVDGTATVTVARYDDNPGGNATTDFNALDKYIDVYVPDTSGVTEIEIRLYYTDAELAAAAIEEESLQLFWWDGAEWTECSDSGVNATITNGYSGYMWAKIRNDTTPSLGDLQGDEFGGYGHPSETPGCGCFIASAAYGTDTAKEIDILREFRDTVLLRNSLGAKFVSLYYGTSPPIAQFISQNEVLRTMVRVGFVDPIVKILTWTHHLWST